MTLTYLFFFSLPSKVAGEASIVAICFSIRVGALGSVFQSPVLVVTIVTHPFRVMRSLRVRTVYNFIWGNSSLICDLYEPLADRSNIRMKIEARSMLLVMIGICIMIS